MGTKYLHFEPVLDGGPGRKSLLETMVSTGSWGPLSTFVSHLLRIALPPTLLQHRILTEISARRDDTTESAPSSLNSHSISMSVLAVCKWHPLAILSLMSLTERITRKVETRRKVEPKMMRKTLTRMARRLVAEGLTVQVGEAREAEGCVPRRCHSLRWWVRASDDGKGRRWG